LVTVHYHPQGLPNDITDNTTASVDMIPTVSAVNPNEGIQGETLDVILTGSQLDLVNAVDFGAGITVNSFTIDSSTQISATITIDAAAAVGLRDVTVANPTGSDTLVDGFTVQQPQTSVNTATGTGVAAFTASSGSITNLTALSQSQLTCGTPPPYYFPHGFFSFTVPFIPPSSTVTITIILPSPVPPITQYWKCQNGTWVDCTSLLGDNDGDNLLTLTITDGGLGDADGLANGTITDPGGPCFASGTAIRRYEGASTGDLAVRRTPPNLKAKYIAVTPKAAQVNQPITITTNVVNEGEISGSHVVALTINGKVEQTRTVTVGPGATRQVSFTIAKAGPGSYQVSIGNQRSAFVVAGPQKPQPSQTTGGLAMGLATLILVVLSGLFIITLRQRMRNG
jgi:hypothetical protein